MLDKLTLHAQLAVLDKNAASLDASIKEKTDMLQRLVQTHQQVALELERLRGAREYHHLLVQQTQQALAEAEKVTTTPSQTHSASPD